MRIIYALFRSNILNKLHECLSSNLVLTPIYVIGDSDKITHKDFDKTIFHSIKESRNGNPPGDYIYKYQTYIDDKFYKFMSKYYEMAISMMGRQSENEWSFSYSERKNHFYYLCNYWYNVIINLKPDFVLFRVVPHFASEYIFFQVCKFHNINPVTIISTPFDYSYLTDDLDTQDIIKGDYNICMSNYVNDYIESNLGSYVKAEPKYMVDNYNHQNEASKLSYFFYSLIKDFVRIIAFKNKYISETIKKSKRPVYKKNSQQTIFSFMLHKLIARINIYKNKHIYKSICSDTKTLPKKYILFAPNYQPERSTMPDAGEFHDTLKILDILSATVPPSYKIIYKEHPMIFNYPGKIFFRGHLFRGEDYYKRAKDYDNVIFSDFNSEMFRLVDNSTAVVSATGTVLFQSSIRGKPVISFGRNWLSSCELVYNYNNRSDLYDYFKNIDSVIDNKITTIDKWKKCIQTICENGFKTPNLLEPSQSFYNDNKQFIDIIVKQIKSKTSKN
jgi:hypothetical protein